MSFLQHVPALAIPLIVTAAGLIMLFSRKDMFAAFTDGAKDGLTTAVRLLPTLAALCVAVKLLAASGLTDALCGLLEPLTSTVGIPPEILPLILTRPFSGSASTAAYAGLLESCGADSFPALCASVLLSCSDTVLYVSAVYYTSVNVRRTRHTLPAAFTVMLLCVFLSCLLCRIFFSGA